MGYNFKGGNREQMYLMPPSIRKWLPEKDLAWFILDAVEQMELRKFYSKYNASGKGQASAHCY